MASDKLFNFIVFENDNPLYSKYNFIFESYAHDTGLKNATKIELFEDFLLKNSSTLSTQTYIQDRMKKYFKTDDDNLLNQIKNYLKKYGIIHSVWFNYISVGHTKEYFEQTQFDLIEYPDNFRVQDFVHINYANNGLTKYNFNFELYCADFNLPYYNKLFVFTDMIFRNYKLTNLDKYANTGYYKLLDGYIVLPEFVKYFNLYTYGADVTFLFNYISKKAVSASLASEKSLKFVNWDKFILLNPELNLTDIESAQEYFFSYGQFEYLNMVFNKKETDLLDQIKNNVVSVYLNNNFDVKLSTGFLFSPNNKDFYLITCFHIIEQYMDQRYLYTILENDVLNSSAQFKIIGYDMITDIMVCKYDPELNYNKIFKPNFYNQLFLDIDYTYEPKLAETLYICGNIEFNDNLAMITASVINPTYSGGFDFDFSEGLTPESMLLQSHSFAGTAGSPVIKKYPDNTFKIVGLLIGAQHIDDESDKMLVSLNSQILVNIIYEIVKKWDLLIAQNITDINLIDDITKNGFPKSWLGISAQYNHPSLSFKYKELSNLPYIGGLLITNFMIGFNFKTYEYVYNSADLINYNVIELKGPLLNTTMYKRFLENGSVPIVIKSIYYHDAITNEYNYYDIGKFKNQRPYSRFIYGHQYITMVSSLNSDYYNLFSLIYPRIFIDYYYFNGKTWVFDVEYVGGNSPDWYHDYKDNMGNLYHQHKFEFPLILLPYLNRYVLTKF